MTFHTKPPEGFCLDDCVKDILCVYCNSFLERTNSSTGTLCEKENVPIRTICVAKALMPLSLIPSEKINSQCWELFNAILNDPYNFKDSEVLQRSPWGSAILEFLS